jgi:hypothetical protein
MFVHLHPNKGSSYIQRTMGLRCPTTEMPIYTQADCYPCPTITNIKMQFFRDDEDYMSIVNAALKNKYDMALQVEIYWYRVSQQKIANATQAVV